jgi:putative tricarboxylic transport membrane protein
MKRDKANLVAGAALVAFGIYVIWIATGMAYVSDVGPGHGFFPLWLGIGLVFFASALIVSSLSAADIGKKGSVSERSLITPLIGWLALMAAIVLFNRLGFFLSFAILTVFLIVALERRPISLAIAVALGLAAAFHVVFVLALDVSLPKAVWGF